MSQTNGDMYCKKTEDVGMTNRAHTTQKESMRTPKCTYQKEPNSTASIKYVKCEC